MIVLDVIQHEAIGPALALLPPKMDTTAARVMLLAIGLQESRFLYRAQKVVGKPYEKGPARGFWQMECGGGVHVVMTHPATKDLAKAICDVRKVSFEQELVHARLEDDDTLAAAFARLLLWADRLPLPEPDADHEFAWLCYLRNWRPGAPRRETWDSFHMQARGQVYA